MDRKRLTIGLISSCVMALVAGHSDSSRIRSSGRRRRSHRLERKRWRGRHCGLHSSTRQPIPRIAYLRHDARSHPRCPECHRPPVSALHVSTCSEPGASPDAAVAAAARDVLVPLIGQLPLELVSPSCIDAGVASVEADYTAALAAIPDNPAKAQGIAVGQAAAAAILALRAADGAVGPFLNFSCPQRYQSWRVPVHTGYPVHRL